MIFLQSFILQYAYRTQHIAFCKNKTKKNAVKEPGIPNALVIGSGGVAIQTVNVHPVISKYG